MDCGRANEFDIISTLNGKCFGIIVPKWQKHLRKMFPGIKDTDLVRSYYYDDPYAKPDIVIVVGSKKIYLSIKSGHNPSCHQEEFTSFMEFLRKSQVPERYLHIISFFHFGRTSKLSNHGRSFTKDEIESQYGKYLLECNEYLATRDDVSEKVIYRAVIRGTRSNVNEIDYFYYGNVSNGFLMSRLEVHDFILSDRSGKMDGAPRFGSLVYQPNGRRADRKEQSYVRIKWPILCLKFYDNEWLEKYS